MSTITVEQGYATHINVFHCEPESQRGLADTIRRETEQYVRHLPGFVSANVHRSTDGRRVTNYAQWTDLSAFREYMQSDKGRQMVAEVRKYAEDIDIHVYDVDWTMASTAES